MSLWQFKNGLVFVSYCVSISQKELLIYSVGRGLHILVVCYHNMYYSRTRSEKNKYSQQHKFKNSRQRQNSSRKYFVLSIHEKGQNHLLCLARVFVAVSKVARFVLSFSTS